jgi:hypothetical protein
MISAKSLHLDHLHVLRYAIPLPCNGMNIPHVTHIMLDYPRQSRACITLYDLAHQKGKMPTPPHVWHLTVAIHAAVGTSYLPRPLDRTAAQRVASDPEDTLLYPPQGTRILAT